MTALDWLKGLWLCISLGCVVIGCFVTESDNEYEKNILKIAFYIQRSIYDTLSDEINMVGVCICIVVASIFVLPCNLILLVIHLITEIVRLIWKGFKKIFKKKGEKER